MLTGMKKYIVWFLEHVWCLQMVFRLSKLVLQILEVCESLGILVVFDILVFEVLTFVVLLSFSSFGVFGSA